MAVTKLSNSGIKTGVLKYDSMLAGNAAFDPAATWLIQRVAGTGSAGTITFSNIPQTYQHLQIRGIVRCDVATTATFGRMQINSDTGSNYAGHLLFGDGSAATATGSATQTYISSVARIPGTSATSDVVGAFIIDIHDYANTSKNKTIRTFNGVDSNTANTNYRVQLSSGLWMSTSAITSISLYISSGNFTTSSSFALYGFKGV